jgi:iron complex outermembrane recepter protein
VKLGYIAAYTEAGLTRVDPAAPAPYPAFLLAGYQTPNIPKWSLSVTADYDWQPTDRWHAHLGGVFPLDRPAMGQRAGHCVGRRSPGGLFLPTYSVLDLNASIAKGPLTLRAFARNVTDQRAWLNSTFGGGPPSMPGPSGRPIGRARFV